MDEVKIISLSYIEPGGQLSMKASFNHSLRVDVLASALLNHAETSLQVLKPPKLCCSLQLLREHFFPSAVPVKPRGSRLVYVSEKQVWSVSRIKAQLQMPPSTRTKEAAWVMRSGCWTVKTAKRTEWCPSSSLMCSSASAGDLMLMKSYLIFYCFQKEPKSAFLKLFLLLCGICYATVLC